MPKHLFSVLITLACCGFLLCGCDGQNDGQKAAAMTSETTVFDDAAKPILPPAEQIYTYLGGLIIPPDLYAKTPTGKVDDLQVCGHEQPDKNSPEICATYGEIYGHLYDYNHVGLDVWDVRENWYLTLARSGLKEIWLARSASDFRAYPDMIKTGLIFMGDWNYIHDPDWPSKVWSTPQGQEQTIDHNNLPKNISKNPMIQLLDAQIMPNKDVWFKVNFTNNLCESSNSAVLTNVWYPAYRIEGRLKVPNFWFYSKGC